MNWNNRKPIEEPKEPITQEDFESFCRVIVRDISPYHKWVKGEMEGFIKMTICYSYGLNHYMSIGQIHQFDLIVSKIGQSIIEIKLTYKYGFIWDIKTVSFSTKVRRLKPSEAGNRLTNTFMLQLQDQIIRKKKKILLVHPY